MSHLITVCPSEGGWALYRDGRALWTFAAAALSHAAGEPAPREGGFQRDDWGRNSP